MEKWQVYGIFPSTATTLRWKELFRSFTNFWLKEKVIMWKHYQLWLVYSPVLQGCSPGSTTAPTASTEEGIAAHGEHRTWYWESFSSTRPFGGVYPMLQGALPAQLTSIIIIFFF